VQPVLTDISSVISEGKCQERGRAKERWLTFWLISAHFGILNLLDSLVKWSMWRILNSVGGLFSRFSGAAANITESASSMLFEERVYGVYHDTKRTWFKDALSRP
jgi:hypothetical protein